MIYQRTYVKMLPEANQFCGQVIDPAVDLAVELAVELAATLANNLLQKEHGYE